MPFFIKTGCQWRMILGCFPNWELVYFYFTKWKNNDVIEQVHELLGDKVRTKAGKYESPNLACMITSLLRQADWAADIGVLVEAK